MVQKDCEAYTTVFKLPGYYKTIIGSFSTLLEGQIDCRQQQHKQQDPTNDMIETNKIKENNRTIVIELQEISIWCLDFNGQQVNMFYPFCHFQGNIRCLFKIGVHSPVQVAASVSLNMNVWQAEVYSDNNRLSSN